MSSSAKLVGLCTITKSFRNQRVNVAFDLALYLVRTEVVDVPEAAPRRDGLGAAANDAQVSAQKSLAKVR